MLRGRMRSSLKKIYAIGLGYGCALALSLVSFAKSTNKETLEVKVVNPNSSQEKLDQSIDQAAIGAQNRATQALLKLLKKFQGKPREAELLSRLAEIYQQTASIEFRIAHSTAHIRKTAVNLSNYHSTLKKAIQTADTLLGKYPHYLDAESALFIRAKSHEELGNKASAIKDYLYLVQHYPKSSQALPSYMALAQFAIDDNKHDVAVQYLLPVEQRPDSPFFPYALYKLAWSQYNLKNIPKALSYLERHVEFYNQKSNIDNGLTTSDFSLRENSLTDATTFYVEGFEMKDPNYTPARAFDYFRALDEGSTFGKMILRFAHLLRAHDHGEELLFWKNEVLQKDPKREEMIDILISVFEFQLNKRRYNEIKDTAQDLVKVYRLNRAQVEKLESYKKAQNLLLDTANKIQGWIVKNKNAQGVEKLGQSLATVYDSFILIVRETDPRIPGVHYNLAEALFEIKKYEDATKHYRWVVENGARHKQQTVQLADASIKAISSRYQVLSQKGLIPTQLKAVSLKDSDDKDTDPDSEDSDSQSDEKNIDPIVSEWIEWIDHHVKTYKTHETELAQNFQFEANRVLYNQGYHRIALRRLIRFALQTPSSKYAVPSATLALDTYLTSQDWARTHGLANRLRKMKEWEKDPFSKKLYSIASDSYYKYIEKVNKSSSPEKVLKHSDRFIDRYPQSDRIQDILLLAGKTAMGLGEREKGETYYSQLIERFPKSPNTGPAIISRASLFEKRYDFAHAARDYQLYLSLPLIKEGKQGTPEELRDLRRKLLKMQWISEDTEGLKSSLASSSICQGELQVECERYQALYSLQVIKREPLAQLPFSTEDLLNKALKGANENRPLWAVVALIKTPNLRFPDRSLLVRIISGRWDEHDPLVQFALLPLLVPALPKAFQDNRADMHKYSKLTASEKSIIRRVDLIKEMEATATKTMKLPWAEIRASLLNEIAELYIDFSQETHALPPPAELSGNDLEEYQKTIQSLVLPFEEKGQDIRSKAFDLAAAFAIEPKVAAPIVDTFFKDNPSQGDALRGKLRVSTPRGITLSLFNDWDPEVKWEKIPKIKTDYFKNKEDFLKLQWYQSMQKRNWPQTAFFLKELKEQNVLNESSLALAQAFSMASAGSRGEAIAHLEGSRSIFSLPVRSRINTYLVWNYLTSYSMPKARKILEELQKDLSDKDLTEATFSDDEAFILIYAADWSKARLSERNQIALLKKASRSSDNHHALWAKQKLEQIRPKEGTKSQIVAQEKANRASR